LTFDIFFVGGALCGFFIFNFFLFFFFVVVIAVGRFKGGETGRWALWGRWFWVGPTEWIAEAVCGAEGWVCGMEDWVGVDCWRLWARWGGVIVFVVVRWDGWA
jgi:hypothetical protein